MPGRFRPSTKKIVKDSSACFRSEVRASRVEQGMNDALSFPSGQGFRQANPARERSRKIGGSFQIRT